MTVLFSHRIRGGGQEAFVLDRLEVACLGSAHVNIDWIMFYFYILLISCVGSGVCIFVCVLFCRPGVLPERDGLKVSKGETEGVCAL